MKKELFGHQEAISIMSQEKEAQIKFYKTCEDKEIEKAIALENKVIVYKTGQSVQTMNMLNRNYKTSFVKPGFLKKAQRANPRLYDIGCYNDNLALMLAPESDETIHLAQESRSKLSDLIRPFDYEKLNNLYDLVVPQRVIPTTSVSRPQLKSNQLDDRVMPKNSQGKKQEVEDHRRNFKFLNNKTFVTACVSLCPILHYLLIVLQLLGTVKFGNDQIAPIIGYGDLSTCYIRDLKGNDLLTGSRGTDMYSITLHDTSTPNLICLIAKASSS
uniref:Integrase, catalytic region, zinc finger, CCHC-type, peptidase aspartic, catalytic n=1 Tax=Tanacetum cinerariifolium TaxID=118510 RepID=A0A699IGI5_TANCI|nr:hypothetical protein [Tanacetum cinerariifolium]